MSKTHQFNYSTIKKIRKQIFIYFSLTVKVYFHFNKGTVNYTS